MSTSMRIALGQFADPTREMLTLARQLGVAGVLFNTPNIPGEHEWAYETLVWLL